MTFSFPDKLRAVAPLAAVNTAGYLLLNHHPFFERRHLPLTALDEAVPFVLWTVWPYLALLLSDVVLPFFVTNRQRFRRMLVAYGVAIALNFTIWALFPAEYERPPVPVGETLTEAVYRLLVSVDAAGNCFPSGHITIPAVGVWAVAGEHRRWAPALWIGLALLSVTILTTKQHYLFDLFGGFATAFVGIVVSRRLMARPRENLVPTAEGA